MPDRRLLDLLELLHQAPGNPAAWLRFLEALRDSISPEVVALFAAQRGETQPGMLAGLGRGVSPVDLEDLLSPSVPHPGAATAPLAAVIELPADGGTFRETRVFRDLLEPAGVRPGPGLLVIIERGTLHVRSATLVLPTSTKWEPTESDRALLTRLAPHMVLARRLHLRLAQRRNDAEALFSAFDHLVLGVLLLDEQTRVSYANRSAAELLGVSPGFADVASLGAGAEDERTLAFRRLRPPEHGGKSNALVYTHPADGRPLHVLTTPFRGGSRDGIDNARFAHAIFIGDPKQRSGNPMRILRERFGLTKGQTRLALLLLAGWSLEEAAGLLEISLSTTRGVLKQVFEKTETHRQAELVRLLLSVFGQIRSTAATPEPRSAAVRRPGLREKRGRT